MKSFVSAASLFFLFAVSFQTSAHARAMLLDPGQYNVPSECLTPEDCMAKCEEVADRVRKTAGDKATNQCLTACSTHNAGLGSKGKGHAGAWMSQCIAAAEDAEECAAELADYGVCIGYSAPKPSKVALCAAKTLSPSCANL